MTITIPVHRYAVGDRLTPAVRPGPNSYHVVKVLSVQAAGAGYDRIRALCDTCGDNWRFIHHWDRWS